MTPKMAISSSSPGEEVGNPPDPAPRAAPATPPQAGASEIQLRVRSEYSFGETFAPIDRLADRLAELGTRAAGIVDPGTWGHCEWDAACRKRGIQPMFGVTLGVVSDLTTEDRPTMWFLALSSEGLKELYRFSSLAQRQAVRGTPRLLYDDVRRMSGDIAKFAGAVTLTPFLREVGAHYDLDPGTPLLNKRKLTMSKGTGARCVAVSDNAFARAEDRAAYEMIARSVKATPQHLLPVRELASLGGDTRLAAEIAERAAGVQLPYAPLIRVEGDLEALARAGIAERGFTMFAESTKHRSWTAEYEQRLQHELALIRSKDFESYFLMVAEMVRYAKQHMLVGPSRGSAAGSLVCYLTRITEVDPIPPRLIFERFIDVTRKDLPDIDLDFPDSKRHMVLEFLQQRYGRDCVAQIGTVSTFQPKSALIAVAKRLGIPPWETNAVKDSIFARSSGDSRANFALLDTLNETEPGRALLLKHPAMRIAADLEAHASHSGVHAAGILVCNEPIENFCTVTADGVAQLDKKSAEKLNLLKIDVLGLRTLGVLEDSGVAVDWYGLKFEDPAVFAVLNEKRFAGIFQFEGPALQSISSQMTISSLDDLGHVTALARPGPMASGGTTRYLLRRAGKEAFTVPHPAMRQYVAETFGIVVYQEQVLRICVEMGGMEWKDTTSVRKAMSGRLGAEYMNQFQAKFVEGAGQRGVDADSAREIWSQINTMGSWAFNLAHSYSYAVVSYWTAWLKAHHPLEFAAATLRNVKDENSAIAVLRELVAEGVGYVAFDPDRSGITWEVRDGKLLGGFTGLKGIGEAKAKAYIEERDANGGRLSAASLAKLAEHEATYADLFPTRSRFGRFYDTPEECPELRPGTRLTQIKDITGEAEFVYIGRLRGKDLRDYNEAIRVKRRNGKKYGGQTLFLDLDIEDDTGKILTRIDRFEFEKMGRPIWEGAVLNTWWIVRGERRLWGKPDGGFKMIYVRKIQQLQEPQR